MELDMNSFDKFVGVLARFTVAGVVVHLTAREGVDTSIPCPGPDCPICKMFEEAKMEDENKEEKKAEPMTFKEWCEVNGRAWVGATARSFEDYGKYLEERS